MNDHDAATGGFHFDEPMPGCPKCEEVTTMNDEIKEMRPAWDGRPLPEIWGTTQVAQELGVRVQNLDKQVGLPKEDQRTSGGRIWPADQIRRFAAARRKRQAA